MQHGDRDDEGDVEPVGDVDMRFGTPHDRAEEHEQVGDPHDRQPEISIPFRFGVFLGLRYAEQVSGAGNENEEIVAEHDEPRSDISDQPRATGSLYDVE